MKLPIYVYAAWQGWSEKYSFTAYSFKYDEGKIPISEHEIEFDAPPVDVLNAGTVQLYIAEQQRIRAEAHVRVENLQKQIDELLALEYKPDTPLEAAK